MNQVRWRIIADFKAASPGIRVTCTYGSATKRERLRRHLAKTHANDAYAMGSFHPAHRARQRTWKKNRRNERVLTKFYDAVYIDTRTGERAKAGSLGCNRTKRSEPRRSEKDLRHFRGPKVLKGYLSIRRGRKDLLPGSIVLFGKERLIVHGTHTGKNGSLNVEFEAPSMTGVKSADIKKLKVIKKRLISSWEPISLKET